MTAGDVASVGVGGLLLGGGIGWMVRAYGLSIDRLRSVELVVVLQKLFKDRAFLSISSRYAVTPKI